MIEAVPSVCFFNRSFYPDQGATGQLLGELAADLARAHRWTVFVVVGQAPGPRSGEAANESEADPERRPAEHEVRVFRARGTLLDRANLTGRVINYLTYFGSSCLLALRLPSVDVVVAMTDPPIVGLAALLLARRSRAPFVLVSQDVFPDVAERLANLRNKPVRGALRFVHRFLVRRAERVVALGETMRRRLVEEKGVPPDRVTVIHNWADCAAIKPLGPRGKDNAFAREQGLVNSFVVMHSGNMGLAQDLEALLCAAERLRDYRDLLLVLVGGGVRKNELMQEAAARGLDNVKFIPFQPKHRLRESFASADCFAVTLKTGLAGYIVPSKLYGFLAAGKPCLVAVEPESEVAELTQRHRFGLRVGSGSPEEWTDKILRLYRDPNLCRELGKRARVAGLLFDRKNQIGLYHQLFEEVVTRRTAQPSWLKRPFDMALSGLGLCASSPLWLLIALGIKLQDGGSVFFFQERVGLHGKPFRGWKFRSMIEHADGLDGPRQARERDERITPLGRLLRATAMDELPQLWNIFRGDMSFVGPRALAVDEIEVKGNGERVALRDIPGFAERHSLRPGLTGIAQVYAARDVTRRNKFRYDLVYVRRPGFWRDLRLIALSFWITFRGKWEERGRKF